MYGKDWEMTHCKKRSRKKSSKKISFVVQKYCFSKCFEFKVCKIEFSDPKSTKKNTYNFIV